MLFANLPALHAEVIQPKSISIWQKVASFFDTNDHEDTDPLPAALSINNTKDELHTDHNAKKNILPNIQGAYYLSSIIYSNHKNWSIWLNDQIIQPDRIHQLSHILIKRVSANKIECTITNQDKTFTLCPNQTLDLSNGHILNGDQRKSILSTPADDDDFTLNESP